MIPKLNPTCSPNCSPGIDEGALLVDSRCRRGCREEGTGYQAPRVGRIDHVVQFECDPLLGTAPSESYILTQEAIKIP